MVTRIAIIFAPPGKRDQAQYFLQKNLPDAKFHNITSQMKNATNSRSTRELATKPRNFLKEKWETTVKRIIENITIQEEFKDKLNILIDHSLLFNGNTREFFPLFNPSYIKKLLPNEILVSHLALLIDDIFDSFDDLTQEGELFSQRATRTFLKNYAKTIECNYTDLHEDPKADSNWISHVIRSLLNWRAKEMIISQSFADQLDAKFLLWGIKQDLEVLCKWINEEKNIFYISHPISEPRSKVKTATDWPDLVKIINSVQTTLKSNDLLTIMPTAIDEFRLEKDNHNYTGKLKLRWPVPDEVKSSLCESSTSLIDDDIDRMDIIHPTKIELGLDIKRENLSDVTQFQDFLNGVYSSMDMRIEYEIGNRDHLLVWSTDGMIVIEPFKIDKDVISGGVQMELLYLQNVNQFKKEINQNVPLSDLRKLCAVFTKKSIEEILKKSSYKEKLVPRLRRFVKKKYNIREIIADSVINNHGQIIDDPSSLGDTTLDEVIEDLQNNISSFREQIIIEQFLSSILTIEPENEGFVNVLILDNLQNLTNTENINKMKNFLENSNEFIWKQTLLEIATSVNVYGNA